MRILFLDCISGISGDMFLGAMVGAGLDFQQLKSELGKLGLDGYDLQVRKVNKKGLPATKLDVVMTEGTNQSHSHRKYSDIVKIIQRSPLGRQVKDDSLGIFELIGKAEAKIHAVPLNDVEFHEIGAIDSIVDIAGAAIAVNSMNISEIFSSPLNIGGGKAIFHGKEFDIPSPAARELLKGIPTYSMGSGEMVTPTGAAIVRHYCKSWLKPEFNRIGEGFGAGSKDFEQPNVLHVLIGEK
ncbi:MAG: LarC family nickel insertion protein [Candidatus Micrarchaeota archaeon]